MDIVMKKVKNFDLLAWIINWGAFTAILTIYVASYLMNMG
jgi:hypothetical protein